ncbi:activator-dependent family glycosyltransferase [Amycolatopsis lurida]
MRVLFVANPEKAHLLAMAPMAWALRTAGHEVCFAGQPSFTKLITQAGLTAVPVGRDGDLWELIPRHPQLRGWVWQPEYGMPAPYDVAEWPERATWQHMTAGYAETLHSWHKPACFPMIAALVEFARQWRPDLVIWEPLALAGPIAAKACGAAHGRLLWGVDVFGFTRHQFLRLKAAQPAGDRTDPLADWLAAYGRKYGFDFTEDMLTGRFTIDQLPDSLRMDAGLRYLSMQYIPYGGPAVVPHWLRDPPERPRIALTMGVSLTEHDAGYSVGVQGILDELSDLDIEVVATIAESEQAKLHRVPGNVRLVSYVPLHALVPTCSAVIHHGGYGTILTIARWGVPQLATPWDFDGPEFSRRVAAQGSALMIRADRATGEAVRSAVRRLLTEPGFRERAASLRAELHRLPSPNQLVPLLEELTSQHRSTEEARCAF